MSPRLTTIHHATPSTFFLPAQIQPRFIPRGLHWNTKINVSYMMPTCSPTTSRDRKLGDTDHRRRTPPRSAHSGDGPGSPQPCVPKKCAAGGHFRPFVTYHCPQGGESSIDFISRLQSYADSITRATVLYISGRILHHAKV